MPVRGILTIEPDSGAHSSFKRPMLVASLHQEIGVQQTRQALLTPIWGVTVVQLAGDVLTLEGVELETDAGLDRVAEHHQIWRCTVVAPSR